MTGPVVSILSGACFGLSTIFTRRGVLKVSDSTMAVMVSCFLAVPLFGFILLGLGQTRELGAFPVQSYLWLAVAGIVHFIVGRSLFYVGIRIIGANMANVFVSCGPIYSVLAGILFLAWGPRGSVGTQTLPPGLFLKGMFSAMAAGLIFGLTPVLIKLGLANHGSPIAATWSPTRLLRRPYSACFQAAPPGEETSSAWAKKY